MSAINRLQQMVGNVYEYEGGKCTVCSVRKEGNFGILETDTGDIKLSIDNIDEELNYFTLKKSNQLMKNPIVMDMVSQSGNMYSQLQQTMLDTIKKVQEDKEYIPQAEAINGAMKQIIDMEKVKISMYQLLK